MLAPGYNAILAHGLIKNRIKISFGKKMYFRAGRKERKIRRMKCIVFNFNFCL